MEQQEKMVVLTLVALLGLVACGTTLPQQRPTDLMIRMTRGGAHPAEGKAQADEIVISSAHDSHYKVEYAGGGVVTLALDVTQEELDELYAVLRDNDFDKMSETEVSTRGTTVTLAWDAVSYTAHENGTSPHGGKYEEKWQKVVTAIKSYKDAQIKGKGIEMPALFDETLFTAAYPVGEDD